MLELTEARARAWMAADMATVADLATGPLYGHALLQLDDGRLWWYQRYHHLVTDGFGILRIIQRAAELYGGAKGSAGDWSLEGLVAADTAYRASAEHAADRDFWHGRLKGMPDEPARLVECPPVPARDVVRRTVELSVERSDLLREAAAAMGTRLSRLAIAAVGAYLHRSSGERDIVLGLPVTARRRGEDSPALMSNVLPLRLAVRQATTAAELVAAVADEVGRLAAHARYRGEDLARELGHPEGLRSLIGPTVNVMPFHEGIRFGESAAAIHYLSLGPVSDLSVAVYDRPAGHGLRIDLDADASVCGQEELAEHERRLLLVLEAMAERPHLPLGRIELSTAPPLAPLPDLAELSWTSAFEQQAERTPGKVAVVCESERLTYAELNGRANALAHLLRARGIGVEDVVAVAVPRSADLVVALLGVMKAGAAYLPLDPDHPADRLTFMVADARARLVVSVAGHAEELPLPRLLMDELGPEPAPNLPDAGGGPRRVRDLHLGLDRPSEGCGGHPRRRRRAHRHRHRTPRRRRHQQGRAVRLCGLRRRRLGPHHVAVRRRHARRGARRAAGGGGGADRLPRRAPRHPHDPATLAGGRAARRVRAARGGGARRGHRDRAVRAGGQVGGAASRRGRLRTDGGERQLHALAGGEGLAGAGADRPARPRHPLSHPRLRAAPRGAGRHGRAVRGGPWAGQGLPRQAWADRRAVRPRPVRRAGRAHVPHRGQGAPAPRREHRLPRPRGRPAQDPRSPDRARRGRERPDGRSLRRPGPRSSPSRTTAAPSGWSAT
ncbi:hypothetical protein GCM10020219_021850 [Nonomuraea dietziae]